MELLSNAITKVLTKGLITGFILLGFCIGIVIWGVTEFFFATNTIRVNEPLKPTLELTIKDNVIDTIYIYETK